MDLNELATLVNLLRSLGVTHYEHKNERSSISLEIGLQGRADSLVGLESNPESVQVVPEALKNLPSTYRNPMLYGGKLPNL